MKITLATPLYPPDIAEPASYIKELAKRISEKHEITIVTYGKLPEKINNVNIVMINKHLPLLARLFLYLVSLVRAAKKTDIIYAQNGPATELPSAVAAVLTKKKLILRFGDNLALNRSQNKKIFYFTKAIAEKTAKFIITADISKTERQKKQKLITLKNPLPRPEIIPFEQKPEKQINEYEKSWHEHINELEKIFQNAKH
jgi:hypothetical protein